MLTKVGVRKKYIKGDGHIERLSMEGGCSNFLHNMVSDNNGSEMQRYNISFSQKISTKTMLII